MYGDAKEFVERHFAGVNCECRVCIGTNRKRLYQGDERKCRIYTLRNPLHPLFVRFLFMCGWLTARSRYVDLLTKV